MASILNFYADESSQSRCKYMVLGGIAITERKLEAVRGMLRDVQVKHRTLGTMKWGKVSQSKLHVYREYCDVFFRESAEDSIHFHSLTVNTAQLDHHRFNAGNAEVGFSKFIYQLIVKVGRLYGHDHVVHCHLDRRKTRQSLNELQEIVNNGLAKNWGLRSRPVRRIVFRETEDEPTLQLNDVLLGALAARCNGHHLVEGASLAKCDLSSHMLKSADIRDPLVDTPRIARRFNMDVCVERGPAALDCLAVTAGAVALSRGLRFRAARVRRRLVGSGCGHKPAMTDTRRKTECARAMSSLTSAARSLRVAPSPRPPFVQASCAGSHTRSHTSAGGSIWHASARM